MKIMHSKKVLVFDANEAPYALYVARSLGSAGYIIDLASSFGRFSPYSGSKYTNKHLFYPDPTYDSDAFLKFLMDNASNYDIILPLMEKTQLAVSMLKKDLEEQGVLVPIPPYSILKKATDKTYVLKVATRVGLPVPNGFILNSEEISKEKVTNLIDELRLPIIVKISTEINVPPGKRYIVAESSRQVIDACKHLSVLGPVMVQEYIKGRGLGVSMVFSRRHLPVAITGHLRILERFPRGGPSVISKTYLHKDAINYSLKLLKELDWQGVAMVEYKLTNNNIPFFMELNPRFWGTLPLALASGVNFPRLLVEKFNDTKETPAQPNKMRILIELQGLTLRLVESRFNISRNILKLLFREILNKGLPSFTEFQYLDLKPFIVLFLREIKRVLDKSKMGRINNILFGPKLPVKRLCKVGIKSIIDLRAEADDEERNEAKKYQIEYYKIPIPDDEAPTVPEFIKGLELLNHLSENGLTYVHCREGMGRAPTFIAGYLIYKGLSFKNSLSYIYYIKPASNINATQKSALWTLFKTILP